RVGERAIAPHPARLAPHDAIRGGSGMAMRGISSTVVVLSTVALAAVACSSNSSSSASGGGDVSGSLNISGSSTVEPITSLVAENFRGANTGVDIAVDGPGT